jgi:uncharacterized protein GlcG (DUF336 family)
MNMQVFRLALLVAGSGLWTGVGMAENATGPAPGVTAKAAARGPALKAALDAAHEAVETCERLSQKIAVTVIDSAGVTKVLVASDGTSARGVQSSTNKAVTALTFLAATSELGHRAESNAELAAKLTANPNFNTHAGGVLIRINDELIGAVGVGGARGSEIDEACALAALKKIRQSGVYEGG